MITDVHHVGIAVRNLDQALEFYQYALSLPCVKEGDMPARGVKVAMLAVGRGYLEIIQPVVDTSPFAHHIAERGEGLHHIGLWSDDVDKDVKRLVDYGVFLDDPEPRDGFTGRLSFLHPTAFDGARIEVVQPEPALAGEARTSTSRASRIDHVVLRVPKVASVVERMEKWFKVPTKRTFDRGEQEFAFLRPGDVIVEVIGPKTGGEVGSGHIAGLALEVTGIDELTQELKAKGYPIGEPHAALQGGRIVSVHHTGACGVPLAFIDFTGSPGPPDRQSDS